MNLKKAILTIMNRDTLKAVVDALELENVDRRSVEDMLAKVSRSRRATPEDLLEYLNEQQVKAVCEQIGFGPKGRRKELIGRLLAQSTAAPRPPKKSSSHSVKTGKRNKRQVQKESYTMTDNKNMVNKNDQQAEVPVRLPDPPPGMMRVTRTELVWPGKYKEDGTLKEVPQVRLPFQVIETVNESRATRESQKGGLQQGLFNTYEGKEGDSFEEGWCLFGQRA